MDEIYIIQTMEEKDLDEVIKLQSSIYYAVLPESKDSFRNKLLLSPTTSWIVKDNFKLIAYLITLPIEHHDPPLLNETNYSLSKNPNTLYIHDLSVAPDKQGMQIGSKLVKKAVQTATFKKYKQMSLVSVQGSTGFWNKFGFKIQKTLSEELELKLRTYGMDAQYLDLKLN